MSRPASLPADSSDVSRRLGQRVRSARAARAMTLKQLSTESGISMPYLSRVERGDGNVSISVLSRLAGALNVSIEALLSDHDRFGPDYALVVEMLKRQSPDGLRSIRSWLIERLEAPAGYVLAEPGPKPVRIALTGLRGAGKSTLGPELATALDMPFIELNTEVARIAGMSINEVFSIYGQAGFRRLERQCLEHVINHYPRVVLATGGGIVAEPGTYELLLHSFLTLWMHATPEVHFQRVMAQHDVRIATPQLHNEAMANIVSALNARRRLYALAHVDIDTTGLDIQAVRNQALSLVHQHLLSTEQGVCT